MARSTATILRIALAELDTRERLDKDEMYYIILAARGLDLITKQEVDKAIAAVKRYPLGCRHIYHNWDSRPRATKVGNLFREINTSPETSNYMCLNLSDRTPLERRAKKAIRTLLGAHNALCLLISQSLGIVVERGWRTRHFYNNWELFHKDISLFRAEVHDQED